MLLWSIIILIVVIFQIIMDFLMLSKEKFITIEFRTYFDLAFLFALLGILYRIYKLQKRGEKEKLRERIKELEEKLKEYETK
jgi:amino acid permease